ncbi:probable magnesium transporter NIPA8 isoform X2 [Physcomitrium patens]|uniref:Probable magnesium transporter n=1 Tax=Physcomitrium patens TaxID=3218 RepID=A0A2K1KXH9_PHYPA|nr:probable magnesium transporter NIPA8 isoform X2 [Physcomitrium patens]PNR58460.1 hypothetical protein PHYPA_005455 [Physcomitrium patens]|eukprot:XP_024371631.1 probable magnesium transporter NIPA8 isoform X2 [Physcomitrella patens]
MGEWITGAAINVVGSICINFGTNLLKLGHNQRERQALDTDDSEDKTFSKKSVTQYQSWRIGVAIFSFGNILNFISFGYAAQSLLAALGSIQFVSNVFFAYLMLNEVVTRRIVLATSFIVVGNGFLVAFGNHQSVIYTSEQLLRNYGGRVYLTYCFILLCIVAVHHAIYRRGRQLTVSRGEDPGSVWRMLLPYTYAVVSGAVGSHSVLFAKSLSVLLRSTLEGENQLDGLFTYLVFFLFAGTASFWMARLNDGLALFDAILIVPMLQIVWTFFSIFTGFIYFEEYRVFGRFRAAMFGVGVLALFVGMSLLAPQAPQLGSKGSSTKTENESETELAPLISNAPSDNREPRRISVQPMHTDTAAVVGQAKSAARMTVGLGQDGIHASFIFSMPMIASARSPWRPPTLNPEWWTNLPDPRDVEDPKRAKIRPDNL